MSSTRRGDWRVSSRNVTAARAPDIGCPGGLLFLLNSVRVVESMPLT